MYLSPARRVPSATGTSSSTRGFVPLRNRVMRSAPESCELSNKDQILKSLTVETQDVGRTLQGEGVVLNVIFQKDSSCTNLLMMLFN